MISNVFIKFMGESFLPLLTSKPKTYFQNLTDIMQYIYIYILLLNEYYDVWNSVHIGQLTS